jgi:voltage-dependent potassium channel beta subunit
MIPASWVRHADAMSPLVSSPQGQVVDYRRLGSSGLQLGVISLGAWATFGERLDEDRVVELMAVAYDAGVNFFDNAESYGNGAGEEVMGRALARLGWPRESFAVSSKVFFGTGGTRPNTRGLSRKHVVEACHAALRRLKVDHLDLYFCHRPDPDTPIAETVRAMSDLVTQGKVLYWGTSEWPAALIEEARAVADGYGGYPPVTEQPMYNLFHRVRVEREYAQLLREGMGATVWSPLASGLLTGKYNAGFPADARLSRPEHKWVLDRAVSNDLEKGLAFVRQVAALAAELGTNLARLAVAWCLTNPHVTTAIVGASSPEQLRDTLGALDVVRRLTPDVLARLQTILETQRNPTPTVVHP